MRAPAHHLVYGVPQQHGLRCPYHGWLFNGEGTCLEQPYDDIAEEGGGGTFKDKIRVDAYPVRRWVASSSPTWARRSASRCCRAGPAVTQGVNRSIGVTDLPCNWLQCMENSLDPVHFEWLHRAFAYYALKSRARKPPARPAGTAAKIGFDLFEYGMIKRRMYQGGPRRTPTGGAATHPLPEHAARRLDERRELPIRVPMDDEHTMHYFYTVNTPGVPVYTRARDRLRRATADDGQPPRGS